MEKKNDLCERLLRFAVDVILYLRTVKNTYLVNESSEIKRIPASIQNKLSILFFLGLWIWNFGLGISFTQEFIYIT
ncbi:MAG: hypothetical protein WC868_11470 [Bacteroidales bacterium]